MARRYRSRSSDPALLIIALAVFLTIASPFLLSYLDRYLPSLLILGVLAVFIFIVFFVVIFKLSKRIRRINIAFSEIDQLEGHVFEQYVSQILRDQGYSTRVTQASGDYGIDVIAEKSGIKTAIQVKRYTGLVGIQAVQEAVGGAQYYNCQNSMVVTNSYFTHQAQNLAKANKCILINRDSLKSWLKQNN